MSQSPRLVAGLIAALAAAAPAPAQILTGPLGTQGRQPTMTLETDVFSNTPRFRVDVTRVEVSVRVTDAYGRPVRGLRAEDFTITEDGQPQTITSFEPYVFTSMPGAAPVLTDGPTTLSNHGTSRARLFVILFDDLHIDPRNTPRARRVAREIISQLEPEDLLLVSIASSQETTGAFSRDRTRALQLIDRAFGMRPPDAMMELLKRGDQAGTVGTGPGMRVPAAGLKGSQQQRSMNLAQSYRAISRVAASVMHLRGRHKTLFLISEGSSVGGAAGYVDASADGGAQGAWREAIAAASVADLAINPVRPTGLATPGEGLIEVRGREVDEEGKPTIHEDIAYVLAQERQALAQLRDAAEMTGGQALVDQNDLAAAVARVIDGAADRYVLSYEPAVPVKDGKWRKIAVSVSRPGLRVEARRGYMAPGTLTRDRVKPPSGLSSELQTLLSDVVPADDLGVSASVVPLVAKGKSLLAAVIVEVDGPALVQGAKDGTLQLEQALFTLDGRGKTANATRKQIGLTLAPAQRTALEASALRAVWAIELTPGPHQLRIATVERATGRGGAVYLDVTVPPDLVSRGVAVASRALAFVPVAFVDKAVQPLLPVVPTATPVFPLGDTLHVTVSAARDGEELRVLTETDQVTWSARLATGPDGVARVDVPLAGLTPGAFTLLASGETAADVRRVPFVVVGR